MATIEATVINNIAGDIKLSASRKGGCSGCAQSKACALTWSPTADNENTAEFELNDNTLNKQAYQLSAYGDLKAGDTIKLECNEQNLLKYICLLFMPSLFALLSFSLLVGQLFSGEAPTLIILLSLLAALSFGAICSRYLLTKHSTNLLKNTITPLK